MKARFWSLFISALFLQGSAASDPDTSKPKPTPPAKPSQAALIQQLPEEERKWLTEFVAPIILPEEQELFLALTEPYQREAFNSWRISGASAPDHPGCAAVSLNLPVEVKHLAGKGDVWGGSVDLRKPRDAPDFGHHAVRT